MPNYCFGYITVRGYKDNVDAFKNILDAHYDYNKMEFSNDRHFFRVFEVYESDGEECLNGVQKTTCYSIECAWSLSSCLFNGEFSYYDDLKKRFEDDFRGTHIQAEAKRLNLFIEMWSEEPGWGFQEHYLINNFGVMVEDECVDWSEYSVDEFESVEEAREELNFPDLTDKEFKYAKENYRYVTRGGFEDYCEDHMNHIDEDACIKIIPIKLVKK